MRMSATVEGLSATAQTSTPRALFTTLPPHVDTASLNRRLDYISVAIVCGIIIICFIICFIVGCRRTKRRRPPRCQDVSTPPTVSHSGSLIHFVDIYCRPVSSASMNYSVIRLHSLDSRFSLFIESPWLFLIFKALKVLVTRSGHWKSLNFILEVLEIWLSRNVLSKYSVHSYFTYFYSLRFL